MPRPAPRPPRIGSCVAAASAVVAALALAGCGADGPEADPAAVGTEDTVTGEVLVLAATSLTSSFTELAARFEEEHPGVTVDLSFGASSALATQVVEGGAPADVFASASAATMHQVVAAERADGAPVLFARNELAIAVPPGNPARIASLRDLARQDVSVALCQVEVPCGALAEAVLAAAGVEITPVTREADVRATLAKVMLGEVDAGVVYVTDVLAAGGDVDRVPIPGDVNAATDYLVAALTRAPNPVAGRAFLAYVLSDEGAAVLASAGFARP